MPENVLEQFRNTGFMWLGRAFAFRQRTVPKYVTDLGAGVLRIEGHNLHTRESEN
jgi:hypothetical protein